jgi:hypothetical protein
MGEENMLTKNIRTFILLIIITITIPYAKPEQLLALTGGLNGFGVKYSFLVNRFGFDAGLPFYYMYGREADKDSIVTTNIFKCNSYFDIKLNLAEHENYDFEVGLIANSTLSFDRSTTRFTDSSQSNKRGSNDFSFDMNFGPFFEYSYKGKTGHKIFGAQLAPLYFDIGNFRNKFEFRLGIQLNYYFKRLNEEPVLDDLKTDK